MNRAWAISSSLPPRYLRDSRPPSCSRLSRITGRRTRDHRRRGRFAPYLRDFFRCLPRLTCLLHFLSQPGKQMLDLFVLYSWDVDSETSIQLGRRGKGHTTNPFSAEVAALHGWNEGYAQSVSKYLERWQYHSGAKTVENRPKFTSVKHRSFVVARWGRFR